MEMLLASALPGVASALLFVTATRTQDETRARLRRIGAGALVAITAIAWGITIWVEGARTRLHRTLLSAAPFYTPPSRRDS